MPDEQMGVAVEQGPDVTSLRLLVIGADPAESAELLGLLRTGLASAQVEAVANATDARAALAAGVDAVVVADLSWPGCEGLAAVGALRAAGPGTALLVLLPPGADGDLALRAIAAGADDCLVRAGEDGPRLVTAVRQAVERVRAQALREQRRRYAARLLDAAASPACAVDAAGTVESVNAAWRAVTAADGGVALACGVGVDYLATCDRAVGEGRQGAAEVARGLRTVLAGGLPGFTYVYPCHSPTRRRWISARITALPAGGGAVVSHVDVTARRLVPPRASPRRPHAPATVRTEAALRAAMSRDELVVHYQPVVDLSRGTVVGVEALVRWQHPEDGLVPPDEFIPAAEAGGLITALGATVLEASCRQAARWHADGLRLHVAVNLSTRQVAHPDLLATVSRVLRETGLDPEFLVLEVTESVVMEDAEVAVVVLGQLAALGVNVSIDDFGTGYSSLLYLRRYPIRALKVDRSFVAGMGADERDDAIVASVVGLARAVGGTCIAEGVETAAQYAALVALGCDFAQGWLFGRAVAADDLPAAAARAETTLAALRAAAPHGARARDHAGDQRDQAAGTRDHAGDQRDHAGDVRDEVADRRDEVAGLRDDAAQQRDLAGDQRDRLGTQRDLAGRRRDTAADRRDAMADARDTAAACRDVAAAERDEAAVRGEAHADRLRPVGGPAAGAPGAGEDGAAGHLRLLTVAAADAARRSRHARRAAASDRVRASEDRHAGATERGHAEQDRGTALADRGFGAAERHQAVGDRGVALADRHAGAGERGFAELDRGTALADRDAGAGQRGSSELDRHTASTDRGASARDRVDASVDGLTGAYRRAPGFLELTREIERAQRTGQPLVVAFVDVDGLKAVNDGQGHAAGDELLREVAATLIGMLRSYDLVVRYGGDEFVCVLFGLSLTEARRRLTGVQQALSIAGRTSVSVGLAELGTGESAQEVVARADAELYRGRARRTS